MPGYLVLTVTCLACVGRARYVQSGKSLKMVDDVPIAQSSKGVSAKHSSDPMQNLAGVLKTLRVIESLSATSPHEGPPDDNVTRTVSNKITRDAVIARPEEETKSLIRCPGFIGTVHCEAVMQLWHQLWDRLNTEAQGKGMPILGLVALFAIAVMGLIGWHCSCWFLRQCCARAKSAQGRGTSKTGKTKANSGTKKRRRGTMPSSGSQQTKIAAEASSSAEDVAHDSGAITNAQLPLHSKLEAEVPETMLSSTMGQDKPRKSGKRLALKRAREKTRGAEEKVDLFVKDADGLQSVEVGCGAAENPSVDILDEQVVAEQVDGVCCAVPGNIVEHDADDLSKSTEGLRPDIPQVDSQPPAEGNGDCTDDQDIKSGVSSEAEAAADVKKMPYNGQNLCQDMHDVETAPTVASSGEFSSEVDCPGLGDDQGAQSDSRDATHRDEAGAAGPDAPPPRGGMRKQQSATSWAAVVAGRNKSKPVDLSCKSRTPKLSPATWPGLSPTSTEDHSGMSTPKSNEEHSDDPTPEQLQPWGAPKGNAEHSDDCMPEQLPEWGPTNGYSEWWYLNSADSPHNEATLPPSLMAMRFGNPLFESGWHACPPVINGEDQADVSPLFAGTRPPQRRKRIGRRCESIIATQLSQLQDEDPNKVLTLRKIARLGFDSAQILQVHYERYGTVSKVLLSNNHEKDSTGTFPTRFRPSGIAFMLFDTVEGAAKALAAGPLQEVDGVQIVVSAFEKRKVSSGSYAHAMNHWNESGPFPKESPPIFTSYFDEDGQQFFTDGVQIYAAMHVPMNPGMTDPDVEMEVSPDGTAFIEDDLCEEDGWDSCWDFVQPS